MNYWPWQFLVSLGCRNHWPSLSKGCRCYCEPAARPSGFEEGNIVHHIYIAIATTSTTVLAYIYSINYWPGSHMKVSTTLTSSGPKTPTRFFTDQPWRWKNQLLINLDYFTQVMSQVGWTWQLSKYTVESKADPYRHIVGKTQQNHW